MSKHFSKFERKHPEREHTEHVSKYGVPKESKKYLKGPKQKPDREQSAEGLLQTSQPASQPQFIKRANGARRPAKPKQPISKPKPGADIFTKMLATHHPESRGDPTKAYEAIARGERSPYLDKIISLTGKGKIRLTNRQNDLWAIYLRKKMQVR